MKPRLTRLQLLRQERHPLVALASFAFVVRLGFLILASALTPDPGLAAGLASLCQPTKQQHSLPGMHDPLACQCGPVCAHGCATVSCTTGTQVSGTPHQGHAEVFPAPARPQTVLSRTGRSAAIRAPPLALT
jgi:hypothetical protein